MSMQLDKDILDRIASQFVGAIWVSIKERANKPIMITICYRFTIEVTVADGASAPSGLCFVKGPSSDAQLCLLHFSSSSFV
jgi:hypothetical protein